MSVLDAGFEETAGPPGKGGAGCAVGKWFMTFDEADRNRIRAVLTSPVQERSNPKVADAINANGGQVSDKQVGQHRLGRCQCERAGWV